MKDLDVTQKQWGDVHTRAALPVGHPKRINRAMVWALQEGRLQLPQPIPDGELPPHHYRVCTTGVLPEFDRLGELYHGAHNVFSDRYVWQLVEGSMARDLAPDHCVFFLKRFGVRTTMEMAMLWGDENDYWPGMHTDCNDLGCAFPGLQGKGPIKGPIIFPGSSVVRNERRFVATLRDGEGGRCLDCTPFDLVCEPHCWFAFVSRKFLGRSAP